MEEGISLSELARKIEQGLARTLAPSYWVVAEIGEIQGNRNGHCYLELIEKPEDEQNPSAKMRATIWANKYRMLAPYFKSETGSPLATGMKILVLASVSFHALYGLSLQITDINPAYTVGEEEQRRQRIIRQLEDEGIIDMNKELAMPLAPQRVAVISSATAAGYQDFMRQLASNQYGIDFRTELFPAAMQGAEVEASVIAQLDAIAAREAEFDAVVIIRGGGSRSDLRWFDNLEIARNVAQFPLPVITGIGHDKDQSITDLVAHTSVKTPTAAAEFLLSVASAFLSRIDALHETLRNLVLDGIDSRTDALRNCQTGLSRSIQLLMLRKENRLASFQQNIIHLTRARMKDRDNTLAMLTQRLSSSCAAAILSQTTRLQVLEAKINERDPESILKQGYTLTTTAAGRVIRAKGQLKAADTIITHFADGAVTSTVD